MIDLAGKDRDCKRAACELTALGHLLPIRLKLTLSKDKAAGRGSIISKVPRYTPAEGSGEG